MKRIFLTAAFTVALITVSNAQFYVGGGVGFNWQNESQKTKIGGVSTTVEKGVYTTAFSFNPRLGYHFSDRFNAGVDLGLGYVEQRQNVGDTPNKAFTASLSPFMRYRFCNFGRFGIFGETALGVGIVSDRSNSDIKNNTVLLNIGFVPVLTYGLNEHWTLETSMNFLNLGYTFASNTQKMSGSDDKAVTNSHNFAIGADANNVFTVGNITVGFSYTF